MISLLKALLQVWLKIAHWIGKVNTAILLTLFYFLVIGVARVGTFLAGKDLLDIRLKDRPSYWKKRENFCFDETSCLKPY